MNENIESERNKMFLNDWKKRTMNEQNEQKAYRTHCPSLVTVKPFLLIILLNMDVVHGL